MYQVEIDSNIALNRLFSLYAVICGHYMCQFCPIDQKRYWVKFKSVRTLRKMACLADRKSYVVIICASSCDKRPIGLIAPQLFLWLQKIYQKGN